MSAILGFYIGTTITVGKMPLAAGCSHHRMQGMIMIGIAIAVNTNKHVKATKGRLSKGFGGEATALEGD